MLAKRVIFLVSSGKKQISPLLDPLEKFWKSLLVPPRESILPTPMITAVLLSILHSFHSSEAVMRLDYQILLKSPPLTLLAGSALHADNAKLNENFWWKAQTAKLYFRKQNTKENLLCYLKKWWCRNTDLGIEILERLHLAPDLIVQETIHVLR